MIHEYFVFAFMFLWMIAPVAIYGFAPRKRRDPYLWVAGATLLGPLVALVFFSLPAPRAS